MLPAGTARQTGADSLVFPAVSISLHPDFMNQSRKRRYLLGISGGRDSVALLHLLLEAGYRNLVLCHLNHQLRGKASGQDAAFVRRLAKKHELPCEIGRENVPHMMAEKSESMELAARNARHRFFAHCSRQFRCKRILLAHHADDQAETVLFNLLRGSQGLKGMRFCTSHQVEHKELVMLRPLLSTTRDEINNYLIAGKIPYRDDASNAESGTTRNKIRNKAIPMLNEIMGRDVSPALVRAEATSQLQQQAIELALSSLNLRDPQGRLFLPKLVNLPAAMQSTTLHHYLKEHGISDINHELIEKCRTLITDKSAAKVNLPGGKFLRRKEKRLFIS